MTANTLDINQKFQQALDFLSKPSRHLFITGKAGTGKSTLLNHFRSTTERPHVVLAPTGVAAVNIEGETIHSFFAFHPGITPQEARKEAQSRRETALYNKIDMLVIDEISMVRADLLDSIDAFLRVVRQDGRAFGGVQMVFIGDLFQLPPVLTHEEKDIFLSIYESPYFFDSIVMQELLSDLYERNLEFIELDTIYRQQNTEFIELLNQVRNNQTDFAQLKKLNERHQPLQKKDDEYVYLVATNKQADEINKQKLDELKSHPMKFPAKVTGTFDSKFFPTEENLVLKTGARVMFIRNDPEGRWINGTLGTVTGFVGGVFSSSVKVKIDSGSEVEVDATSWDNYKTSFNRDSKAIEREITGSFTQIPLKLAWAFTIHKSQGKTFDKVILDIGTGAFAHGQTYVALSRCRSLEGLILKKPIRSFDIRLDKAVVDFMKKLSA